MTPSPPKSLLLDSGPLLLLVVGLTHRGLIRKHKRTTHFSEDDFDQLWQVVGRYPRLLTTPGVLTEVSNHLEHHAEPERGSLFKVLAEVIGRLVEIHRPSEEVRVDAAFSRLGLTDTGFLFLIEKPHVVTSDGKLCQTLLSRGFEAAVFPSPRSLSWFGGLGSPFV